MFPPDPPDLISGHQLAIGLFLASLEEVAFYRTSSIIMGVLRNLLEPAGESVATMFYIDVRLTVWETQ